MTATAVSWFWVCEPLRLTTNITGFFRLYSELRRKLDRCRCICSIGRWATQYLHDIELTKTSRKSSWLLGYTLCINDLERCWYFSSSSSLLSTFSTEWLLRYQWGRIHGVRLIMVRIFKRVRLMNTRGTDSLRHLSMYSWLWWFIPAFHDLDIHRCMGGARIYFRSVGRCKTLLWTATTFGERTYQGQLHGVDENSHGLLHKVSS